MNAHWKTPFQSTNLIAVDLQDGKGEAEFKFTWMTLLQEITLHMGPSQCREQGVKQYGHQAYEGIHLRDKL